MSDKSCMSCPSYVAQDKVKAFLGTTYGRGVAYCKTRGIPLGVPDKTVKEATVFMGDMADSCPSYGERPEDLAGRTKQMPGFVGSMGVPVSIRTTEKGALNCSSCVYYASPVEVGSTFGWPVGLCKAKGNLIPGKLLASEAAGCSMGIDSSTHPDMNFNTLGDFTLIPTYDLLHQDPALVLAEYTPAEFIEPTEYESDLPVTPEHEAMGIRAWMKIVHPRQGEKKKPIFLPIFRDDFFDPAERGKIPRTGDESHPELYCDYQDLMWSVCVNMMGLDRTPVLIGPAGTGKTEFFNYLAWKLQLPFDRISITNASEIWDIIGKHLVDVDPDSGESITVWVNGRLPKRWAKPGVLLIDEPNAGPNEIWQAIRPLTDNSKQLVLDQDRGQKVDRNPWCFFGMAMNPSWDLRYIGTAELNEADGNRLGAVWVDFPPDDIERDIVVSKCHAEGYEIPQQILDDVMNIADEIRQLADPSNGVLRVSWGVRLQVAAALYTQYSTHLEAYAMAIADRLEPSQRDLVLNVVRGHDSASSGSSSVPVLGSPVVAKF